MPMSDQGLPIVAAQIEGDGAQAELTKLGDAGHEIVDRRLLGLSLERRESKATVILAETLVPIDALVDPRGVGLVGLSHTGALDEDAGRTKLQITTVDEGLDLLGAARKPPILSSRVDSDNEFAGRGLKSIRTGTTFSVKLVEEELGPLGLLRRPEILTVFVLVPAAKAGLVIGERFNNRWNLLQTNGTGRGSTTLAGNHLELEPRINPGVGTDHDRMLRQETDLPHDFGEPHDILVAQASNVDAGVRIDALRRDQTNRDIKLFHRGILYSLRDLERERYIQTM